MIAYEIETGGRADGTGQADGFPRDSEIPYIFYCTNKNISI